MNRIQDVGALACITMDIEPDYTQIPHRERGYGLFDTPGHFERFAELMARHEVKLTCFVVGHTLRDRPDHIRELSEMGVEFGPHSLTHDLAGQGSEREIRGGIDAFTDFFGRYPRGYRSAQGRVTKGMLEMLEKQRIVYDSSVIPSIRPGVYWNADKPTDPFRWRGLSLVELPIGAIPRIRLPLALSYIKILGPRAFATAQSLLGVPQFLVFLLHPMDLTYDQEAYKGLSTPLRVAYSINRSRGWELLDWYLARLRNAGYRFACLGELYERVSVTALPEVSP
jgi:peptidoglycan/xylan/chitin deacetylase (PgdA/CDA1 family)